MDDALHPTCTLNFSQVFRRFRFVSRNGSAKHCAASQTRDASYASRFIRRRPRDFIVDDGIVVFPRVLEQKREANECRRAALMGGSGILTIAAHASRNSSPIVAISSSVAFFRMEPNAQ
ncbi:hypothetical protein [Jiella sp. M17.18]|uniref:hypothetical protein n=1 Tax=Jiella sp. M17.18 TaxID=3234247 RepID=UPI0034DE5BD8